MGQVNHVSFLIAAVHELLQTSLRLPSCRDSCSLLLSKLCH